MKNNENEERSEPTWEVVESTTAIESIERASVDMMISTAKRYPRSPAIVKKRMLDVATLDQETAASCFYRLNRKGKMIEGPTIRLAEIAGSCFGNLRYGARVISNDGKVVTAQGYCFDLETNVMSQVEVQRRITDKDGQTYSQDMQVVTGNAACAIALRNAMFKVVPFALIKPIFSAAKKAAVGDIKTLSERRTVMLAKFAAFGVNEKRILATLGKQGVEEIGLEDLETLIGLHNAIEDKEQTVDEAFPIPIEKPKISRPGTPKEPEEMKQAAKPTKEKLKLKKTKPFVPPTPFADELATRLHAAGFTVANLYDLAVGQKWANALEETPVRVADFIGEDKAEVFLDPDNWAEILKGLEEAKS